MTYSALMWQETYINKGFIKYYRYQDVSGIPSKPELKLKKRPNQWTNKVIKASKRQ